MTDKGSQDWWFACYQIPSHHYSYEYNKKSMFKEKVTGKPTMQNCIKREDLNKKGTPHNRHITSHHTIEKCNLSNS